MKSHDPDVASRGAFSRRCGFSGEGPCLLWVRHLREETSGDALLACGLIAGTHPHVEPAPSFTRAASD
jgi:hypothetical protein